MRRLILQPPRTCNCFHLVLSKFCIFDTCNFAFPSGDWQREIGCAEAKVRTCHFQCPDNYWPNAKKAVPLHSHSSEWISLKDFDNRNVALHHSSSPHSSIALWGPQEKKPLSTGDNISCQRTIQGSNEPCGHSRCAKARSNSLRAFQEAGGRSSSPAGCSRG